MSIFGSNIPLWDSTEGLSVARDLEEKLSGPCGCHFALGGSVMYRGQSNKDLDIIVYPHEDRASAVQKYSIVAEIEKLGFVQPGDHFADVRYASDRAMITELNGRRVDFLFIGY